LSPCCSAHFPCAVSAPLVCSGCVRRVLAVVRAVPLRDAGCTETTPVKMDATANDVPPSFEVRGFPTLFWIPKGDKANPKRYEGGRAVDDFVQYIAKEATSELKTLDRKGKPKKTEL